MRIIAYETSRLTVLFPYEEVVPLAGVNDREIVEKITARYKFLKSPSLVGEETTKSGYRFEAGQITVHGTVERIADFAIFRDGIVINSAKTDNSEALLDDVIGYMKHEFSYRDFITPPRRYFQSQIVVEFDRSPEKLIVPLNKIAAAISEPLKEIYGSDIPMKFGRLDFAADKLGLSVPAPTTLHNFIIERRFGIPFEKERFFCSAPCRSATHVSVLEKIEALLP
jgi:hypothetical protein